MAAAKGLAVLLLSCFLLCSVSSIAAELEEATLSQPGEATQANSAQPTALGVCWYPEQWPQSKWKEDTQEMALLGIKYVRLGEFMWSTLEPRPGQYEWMVLDQAIEAIGSAGLKAVLGTPTATPPKWLVDEMEAAATSDNYTSILPVGVDGQKRKFGSRRHYSFSSPTYRAASERIVTALAQRYGHHRTVAGWQIDNEFGCHNTVRSYDPNALASFRTWLQARYGSVEALNEAWGTAFWSMAYGAWSEVDLPNLTVTVANPSLWLDFYRFASEQVVQYNRMQADIIRAHAPGRFITHNFMGNFFDFDHYAVAQDLDFAAWDNYPLGFTDMADGSIDSSDGAHSLYLSPEDRIKFARTGHPDWISFQHDLYRSVSKSASASAPSSSNWTDANGGFWVMEQQPGPVNWAAHNPSPAPRMVRSWTWSAVAHGANVVSYFRWREAAFAQEQMHAGLKRRDDAQDMAYTEVEKVVGELSLVEALKKDSSSHAKVALVFDYEAYWYFQIQPQGQGWSYYQLVFAFYSAVRSLGLDVDIVRLNPSTTSNNHHHHNSNNYNNSNPLNGMDAPLVTDLSPYSLVLIPSLPYVSPQAVQSLQNYQGFVVMGPRTGSKTLSFQIPQRMPPSSSSDNGLEALLPFKVFRVESFMEGDGDNVTFAPNHQVYDPDLPNLPDYVKESGKFRVGVWKEWIEMPDVYGKSRDYQATKKSEDSTYVSADGSVRLSIQATFEDETPALLEASYANSTRRLSYLAFWPATSSHFLSSYLLSITQRLQLPTHILPPTLRTKRRGDYLFLFNYDQDELKLPFARASSEVVLATGHYDRVLGYDVGIWRCPSDSNEPCTKALSSGRSAIHTTLMIAMLSAGGVLFCFGALYVAHSRRTRAQRKAREASLSSSSAIDSALPSSSAAITPSSSSPYHPLPASAPSPSLLSPINELDFNPHRAMNQQPPSRF